MAVILASFEKAKWDFTAGDSGNIDVFLNDDSDIDFNSNFILGEMPKGRESRYDFDIEGSPRGKFFSAWVYIDLDDLTVGDGLITDDITGVFERYFNDFAADEDPHINLYVRRTK